MSAVRPSALPAAATERFSVGKPALLFVGLMLVLYADPLFVRRNFAGRDLNAYNLPMEKSVHDAWARGQWPVWSPEVSGGRPLLPNPNAGATYPIRILVSQLAFPLAFRVYPVLHWIAAGLGMLALCRAIGRSAAASWVAAVTYAFSGVGVGELFYPHIHPGMALLPWIVWAAARRSGTRGSRFLVLAVLFALDLLAGDVFTASLAIVCAAGWIALEDPPREPLRAAGGLALAVGLGALAAAPQIVATMAWIPLTNRGILGMKLGDVLLFTIHPWRLLELVVPYPFGPAWHISSGDMWGSAIFHGRAMGLFPTLYAGAFAVMAVPIAWRSAERGARFARVVLAGGLASSVLPSLLPASWATWSSPLPLRNPEKFAVAVILALALFAALAVDGWRRRPGRMRWPLAAGAVLAAAAAACAWNPDGAGRAALRAVGGSQEMAQRASPYLASAFAEAGLLWMATVIALGLLAYRGGRGGIAGALVLLTAVPVVANRRIARSFRGGGRVRPDGVRALPSPGRSGGRLPDSGRDALPADLAGRGCAVRGGALGGGILAPNLVRPVAGALRTGNGLQRGLRCGRPLAGREPAPRLGPGEPIPRFGRLLRILRAEVGNPLQRPGAARRLRSRRRRRAPGLGRASRARIRTSGSSRAGERFPPHWTDSRRSGLSGGGRSSWRPDLRGRGARGPGRRASSSADPRGSRSTSTRPTAAGSSCCVGSGRIARSSSTANPSKRCPRSSRSVRCRFLPAGTASAGSRRSRACRPRGLVRSCSSSSWRAWP